MSATDSNLSAYGCDLVVATTQEAICTNMAAYFNSGVMPTISVYYALGDTLSAPPVLSSLADLAATLGDPSIPDPLEQVSWNDSQPTDINVVLYENCYFSFAFRIQLGVPEGYVFYDQPGIITFNPDGASVTFRLLCSQFDVATATYDDQYRITVFTNESQQQGQPWIFEINVPITSITNNANLPPAVQAQVDTLPPDTFSVQQLLLDYASGSVVSAPAIPGVSQGTPVYDALVAAVMSTYFNALQELNMPALAYTIVNTSTSGTDVTSCEAMVNFYIQPDPPVPPLVASNLATLNFICAVNGDTLPTPTSFSWNWTDTESIDGVVAIKAGLVAGIIDQALSTYVASNCYVAQPSAALGPDPNDPNDPANDSIACFVNFVPGGQPTIAYNPSPGVLLSYSFESNPPTVSAGGSSIPNCSMMGYSQFSLQVSLQPGTNQVVITQSLVVYVQQTVTNYLTGNQQLCVAFNPANVKYVETYGLAVNTDGTISFSPMGTPVQSEAIQIPDNDPYNGPFPQQTVANFEAGLRGCINPDAYGLQIGFMPDIPANPTQACVFPCGNTFSYNGIIISSNNDLVTNIGYTTNSNS